VIDSGLDAELWIDGDPDALPPHPFEVREQQGGDLGERMLAVCTDIAARKRAPILVGSDCPVLDASYLCTAWRAPTSSSVRQPMAATCSSACFVYTRTYFCG
jgi:hypothetical protein